MFLQSCVSTYGSGTPNGVKVYTSVLSNHIKSQSEAENHCKKYNKKAVLVDSSIFPIS